MSRAKCAGRRARTIRLRAGNLDYQDGQKLDEFMTSVREIEQRRLATKEERLEGWQPSISAPDMKRLLKGTPQDAREHMKLMLDLIVLAWQMDKTRIATLLFNRDVSHMQFDFLKAFPTPPCTPSRIIRETRRS